MIIEQEKKEGLAEIYNQLVELVGIENTQKIYDSLKGQQVTFPMRLYKPDYVSQKVKKSIMAVI